MTDSVVLDVLLGLLLIGYLVYGFRHGLLHSVGSILGVAAGAIGAVLLIPLLGSWIPEPGWRIAATLAVLLVLLVGGQVLGASVAAMIRRRMKNSGLRAIDRVLGAVVSVLATALVLSMVSVSIAALGVPLLSTSIGSSVVLQRIDALTPAPVKTQLAQLRATVTNDGLPRIVEALGGPVAAPDLPTAAPASAALDRAAQSVVRITGNAYACGQSQSGSGFVVAEDRVVTNAHVVAGVSEPVVEVPGKGAQAATIVYFDPTDDLAVLAVDGLTAAPLRLTTTLAVGSAGVTDGYPFGGPFVSLPAQVISVATTDVNNIYNTDQSPRSIYTLAADVQQGDSGGPLLSEAGEVAGVVFAKSATTSNVGYAVTMEELLPVAQSAEGLVATVSSGDCIDG
ncbi:MarP family serine protease [Glaciihabitans tibetensis]|nr:MarP family serine protease [Glaciihabitans tibetensis]